MQANVTFNRAIVFPVDSEKPHFRWLMTVKIALPWTLDTFLATISGLQPAGQSSDQASFIDCLQDNPATAAIRRETFQKLDFGTSVHHTMRTSILQTPEYGKTGMTTNPIRHHRALNGYLFEFSHRSDCHKPNAPAPLNKSIGNLLGPDVENNWRGPVFVMKQRQRRYGDMDMVDFRDVVDLLQDGIKDRSDALAEYVEAGIHIPFENPPQP